jgi:hypothetical protein
MHAHALGPPAQQASNTRRKRASRRYGAQAQAYQTDQHHCPSGRLGNVARGRQGAAHRETVKPHKALFIPKLNFERVRAGSRHEEFRLSSGHRGGTQKHAIKKIAYFAQTAWSVFISDRPTRHRQLLARSVSKRLRESTIVGGVVDQIPIARLHAVVEAENGVVTPYDVILDADRVKQVPTKKIFVFKTAICQIFP